LKWGGRKGRKEERRKGGREEGRKLEYISRMG
jgi:hypothetical protein